MATFFDAEYKVTKLIAQGEATLESPLAELAAWIASRWQVRVLNVIYGLIKNLDNRPRLQVILEHDHERRQFFDGRNFDQQKQQAIAARFAEIVSRPTSAPYSVDRLLVVFLAFAPLARQEADSRITHGELAALQDRLANPDLWTIHRSFGHVTFMFYTDVQAREHSLAGFRETYGDLYFELLQRYDEFGYLSREQFSVQFDSKENFDKNYEGSWFYYDR